MTESGSAVDGLTRAKQFLQGFFLPVLFAVPGIVAFPFLGAWDNAHDRSQPGMEAIPIAAICAIAGTVWLARRWRESARWRSYGVIAGFFAIPVLLWVIYVLVVTFTSTQLHPR
jgi:hypothetical protein